MFPTLGPLGATEQNLTILTGSAGAPTPPNTLFSTDLAAWYKADTEVYETTGGSLAANNNTIQQWKDQSGNGVHLFNNSSPFRPVFKSASAYNAAKPCIDFTAASGQYLWTALQSIPSANTEISAFVVGRMRSGTNGFGRILSWNTNSTATDDDHDTTINAALLLRDNSNNGFSAYFNSAAKDIRAISLATNYRLGVVFEGTTARTYVNGVAGSGGAATPNFGANGALLVGGVWSSFFGGLPGDVYFDGEILEIVIVKREATSGEISDLETYFITKWGS